MRAHCNFELQIKEINQTIAKMKEESKAKP